MQPNHKKYLGDAAVLVIAAGLGCVVWFANHPKPVTRHHTKPRIATVRQADEFATTELPGPGLEPTGPSAELALTTPSPAHEGPAPDVAHVGPGAPPTEPAEWLFVVVGSLSLVLPMWRFKYPKTEVEIDELE